MPLTPDSPAGALTLVQIEQQGVKPQDIDSQWMDQMVKRLFMELQKQLARIEATKPNDSDTKNAQVRAANVRALASIERTLERLARMEQQRVASRKVRNVSRNEELRIEIERRIAAVVTYRGTPEDPGESR